MYAVITGASRGIGKELAYKFASNGYNLILTCERNYDLLNDIKIDICKKYNREVIIKMGLLEEKDLKDDIYILINNAGKCDYNIIQDVNYDKYKEIIYANLDYTFLTTKLVSKIMLKHKQGVIINISSMWGILGAATESIYSMTKGGINAFTKSIAKEFINSNVDVIAFALGAVDTEMNNNLSESEKKDFVLKLDGGKMFSTKEIADTIYDYVLHKNYRTGDIIELDNGLK